MKTMRFEPKEDITAYELAVIYGNVGAIDSSIPPMRRDIIFTDEKWSELPDNIKRHFK